MDWGFSDVTHDIMGEELQSVGKHESLSPWGCRRHGNADRAVVQPFHLFTTPNSLAAAARPSLQAHRGWRPCPNPSVWRLPVGLKGREWPAVEDWRHWNQGCGFDAVQREIAKWVVDMVRREGRKGKEMRRNCHAQPLENPHRDFHGPHNATLLRENPRKAMLKLSLQPTAVMAIESDLLALPCCVVPADNTRSRHVTSLWPQVSVRPSVRPPPPLLWGAAYLGVTAAALRLSVLNPGTVVAPGP